MKYKLSVIFLFLCLILFIIYNKFDKSDIKILFIGESTSYDYISRQLTDYKLDSYLFNNITYNEIYKNIKNNHYKIIKDNHIYLNQEIGKSDVIILNANNYEYKLKCRRNERIIREYNDKVNNDINNLVLHLQSIFNVKIIIIGNYCDNINFKYNGDKFTFINYSDLNNINKILVKSINN